ncbi:MAG: SIR2 family protein [Ignavibacteria bacterium]|jgi:hypothetical protein
MNNTQIFTPDELTINESKKNDLFEAILNKETVLFVGSGLSQPIYPCWEKLIITLEDLAITCNKNFKINEVERNERPWDYVYNIKKHIQQYDNNINRYYDKLANIFSDQDCLPIHRKLISLPFLGFITTNYDTLLEKALIEKGNKNLTCFFTIEGDNVFEVSGFFASLNNSLKKKKKIVHIHGVYNHPSTIILGYDDYQKYYGLDNEGKLCNEPTLHYKFLWAILATRRVVFVGFSMKDVYLKYMLSIVCNDLWQWQKASHFFITEINKENKTTQIQNSELYFNNFGITTIFYENPDGSHKNFESLFEEIIDYPNQDRLSININKKKVIESSKFEKVNKKTIKEIKDWANEVNRKMINKSKYNEA